MDLKAKLEGQVEALKQTIAHIQEGIDALDHDATSQDPCIRGFLDHRNLTALTQDILAELVDTIYIHEGGGVTLQFRFRDPWEQSMKMMRDNPDTGRTGENQDG